MASAMASTRSRLEIRQSTTVQELAQETPATRVVKSACAVRHF
jgi:hypothetical protein